MLEVTVILDSPVADIFASKCCGGGLPDQTLEIHVMNRRTTEIALQSRLRLASGDEALDWTAVCPAGGRRIPPGDVVALYADLDAALIAAFHTLILFEANGTEHRFPLGGGQEIAGRADA